MYGNIEKQVPSGENGDTWKPKRKLFRGAFYGNQKKNKLSRKNKFLGMCRNYLKKFAKELYVKFFVIISHDFLLITAFYDLNDCTN